MGEYKPDNKFIGRDYNFVNAMVENGQASSVSEALTTLRSTPITSSAELGISEAELKALFEAAGAATVQEVNDADTPYMILQNCCNSATAAFQRNMGLVPVDPPAGERHQPHRGPLRCGQRRGDGSGARLWARERGREGGPELYGGQGFP
jgi:hypothetical protein